MACAAPDARKHCGRRIQLQHGARRWRRNSDQQQRDLLHHWDHLRQQWQSELLRAPAGARERSEHTEALNLEEAQPVTEQHRPFKCKTACISTHQLSADAALHAFSSAAVGRRHQHRIRYFLICQLLCCKSQPSGPQRGDHGRLHCHQQCCLKLRWWHQRPGWHLCFAGAHPQSWPSSAAHHSTVAVTAHSAVSLPSQDLPTPARCTHAQNSNISGNHVGSVGTLLGYGGGVYVADHCTNGVCGRATATLSNNHIDGNYAHEACTPKCAWSAAMRDAVSVT